MTANNGWPGKPGVPLNPEKDGWHWLKRISNGWETLAKWDNDWNGNDDFGWNLPGSSDPERVAKSFQYLGPVATLEEIAAKDARIAALETAIIQCKALSAMLKPQADRIAELKAQIAALQRDASQEIAADELVRRLQHLGDWQAADRIEALQKRVAELEAQNEMLRHATNKLRAMLTELNARHEPLQRAFITAVELLNDAALTGGKDE